jgi:PLP dependent protein
MSSNYELIKSNLSIVREHIVLAAHKTGRNPESIKLVAVSKGQSIEKIEAAICAGITNFGENYPEELERKLGTSDLLGDVTWHMIGHLQSRKIKLAIRQFSIIHSLDSIKLAERLNSNLEGGEKVLSVLMELNVGAEPTKNGWVVNKTQEWGQILEVIKSLMTLRHIKVCGLMVMPPMTTVAENNRQYFAQLLQIREYIRQNIPDHQLDDLSMGTSADYKVAIEEGATIIRIGRAIFGTRLQ